MYDEITTITEIEEDYTIDIEVDDDHLFYANDILTHNSVDGIGMESIAESIAIAQVASTMIGIIVDEQRPDIRTLSIIKSRKVNKSKIKAQNVHINTDLQKVWDFEGEKRVYLKQEQKEDLTLLNNIVEASEKVDEKTDFNSGTNLLEQLLRK